MGAGSGPVGPEGVSLGWQTVGRPNAARIYDYLLGGKDNLAVDRRIAAQIAQAQPLAVSGARANRAFLRRAVTFLAEAGVDQFIDCGSGLPTVENVHTIAGRINPRSRVIYVDNDPVALAHARALLVDSPQTVVIEGDVREPERILTHPDLRALIDATRPVAVLFVAVLHFLRDSDDPAGVVAAFRDVMAPGSALVVSHVVADGNTDLDAATHRGAHLYSETAAQVTVRSRTQIASWFHGFRLVEPGLVDADTWRRHGTSTSTNTSARTAPIAAGVGLLDPADRPAGAGTEDRHPPSWPGPGSRSVGR